VEELVHRSGSNQAGGREESDDRGGVHLDGGSEMPGWCFLL
jgi:hypothetical protein